MDTTDMKPKEIVKEVSPDKKHVSYFALFDNGMKKKLYEDSFIPQNISLTSTKSLEYIIMYLICFLYVKFGDKNKSFNKKLFYSYAACAFYVFFSGSFPYWDLSIWKQPIVVRSILWPIRGIIYFGRMALFKNNYTLSRIDYREPPSIKIYGYSNRYVNWRSVLY